jgi:uncharacterized Tic20 family protein
MRTVPPQSGFPVNGRGRAYDPNVADDEKTWALLAHLSLLASVVLAWGSAVIPLVIWLVKKENSPFVDDHAREALNFQITLILYSLLVIPIALITCGVGAVLIVGIYILGIIGMIQAAMASNRGEFYRYPMTLRLIG